MNRRNFFQALGTTALCRAHRAVVVVGNGNGNGPFFMQVPDGTNEQDLWLRIGALLKDWKGVALFVDDGAEHMTANGNRNVIPLAWSNLRDAPKYCCRIEAFGEHRQLAQ